MDLQIRNFGAIENADVKFDGLTVIAGENDTGKSTVGKLVFAVIKAISRYEQDLEMSKEHTLNKLVKELYIELRKNIYNFDNIKSEFTPSVFVDNLISLANPGLFQNIDFEYSTISNFFDKKKNLIIDAPLIENSISSKDELILQLKDIETELKRKDEKSEILKKALTKVFISEFHLEFTTDGAKYKTTIDSNENGSKLFAIQAEKNNIISFDVYDEVLSFDDVTFIDTPMVLQLHDSITRAKVSLNKDDNLGFFVPLHVKGLTEKIRRANKMVLEIKGIHSQTGVLGKIKKIIGGNWLFDEEKEYFIFSKNGESPKKEFRSNNTASGIKSFGIIQLLLLAEILNNRSLLIIDEPETHLHPKWQVEYAKVICLLVKHEIPVLLTSHSPYLIQALRHYSEEYGIERFTNYYLAERNDNDLVDIEHVNDDLNRVFIKLSQPLHELVWQ